jgi:hypothetical protein
MAWVALIVCGLILWAASAGVFAMGRDIWPGEIPEAVRLAAAPTIAAAATVAHKIMAPDFNGLVRAAAFTLIVAALDALVLAPVVDRNRAIFGEALGSWLPFAAIFAASYLTGAFSPT